MRKIQSQMNPHFIFNAMNNIKYFLRIKENKLAEINFII
jgi:LytS/YehU family sensor histidine kinase